MTRLERKFLYVLDCPKRPLLHGVLLLIFSGALLVFSFGRPDVLIYLSMFAYYTGLLLMRKDVFIKEMKQMRADHTELGLVMNDQQWEQMSEIVNAKMFYSADGMWMQMRMLLLSMLIFMVSFIVTILVLAVLIVSFGK